MTKPFSMKILLKKIDVLCRNGSRQEHRWFEDGFLLVDFDAARAWVGGKECVLTPTEFRMLRYFTENAGVLLTYSVLLEKLWDSTGAYVDKHTLAVNVNRLRKKIEDEEDVYKRQSLFFPAYELFLLSSLFDWYSTLSLSLIHI